MRKVVIGVVVVLVGLVGLCLTCMAAGLVAGPEQSSTSAGVTELDGRYSCLMAGQVMQNGLFVLEYRPAGLSFTIDGDSYSSTGGDGTITADAEVVTFIGGGYDGWRGARRDGAIIFRKAQGEPRPGEGVRFGDFRCSRR